MDLKNIVYCRWELLRFVIENKLVRGNVFRTLSVTANDVLELRMYLGKTDDGRFYEVRIYKTEPGQVYIHHVSDMILFYTENDEYATFQFEDFDDALDFLNMISIRHPEYRTRPMRRLPKE